MHHLAARYREILRQAVYVVRSTDADGELSSSQVSTLNMLTKAPLRISDIARNAGIRLPSATEQVTKLAAAGLVKRLQNPNDARVVEVLLTEQGRATLEASNLRRNQEVAAGLSGLSLREQQSISRALSAIAKLNAALSP
ncbi:MarR family transcriptional regulator [Arthrobacter sp. lap29]|uniref:MarR family winged helix-turn-helix transcriptional regulator n=1 Tax=Arthrobacter sp. lap29 TaxID=3056122 RepID=UPI0028F6C1F7|nr:MarR family transcriptional regulator [Arthrobacter sp. lap29]